MISITTNLLLTNATMSPWLLFLILALLNWCQKFYQGQVNGYLVNPKRAKRIMYLNNYAIYQFSFAENPSLVGGNEF